MPSLKDEINVKKIYGESCILSKDNFIEEYNFNINGLSSKDADEQLNKYGKNEISQSKPKRWYNYFFESLFSPFNSILLGITLVLLYTDVIIPETPSYANIIVILVLVLASTLLEFFEEFRSNRAAEKLKELVATTSNVIRDNKEIKIPIKDITVGDVVALSSGSMIPADLRIIEAKDLYVGQSSLTGESEAVKKLSSSELKLEDINSVTDLDTICFMGSNVISGTAKGIVIKVADSTYLGKIAHTLTTGKPQTSFQKGVQGISKLLIKFMLIMIPLVFVLT